MMPCIVVQVEDGDITLANLEGQAMRCMLFMLLWPDEPCVLQYVGTVPVQV